MMQISVVTPTLHRPSEVQELLQNLAEQGTVPAEVIIVDGAEPDDERTREVVDALGPDLPFPVRYLRSARGTALQRNAGIEVAQGELIAFVDDDVRLDPPFLGTMAEVFAADDEARVGGVAGYRGNLHFRGADRARWRWYRRLHLLSTYQPGAYDRRCGYPVNNSMQPPFAGTRPVDFMSTAAAVWRREVFDEGLRFDPVLADYGVLEDAHFALRAGRRWQLLQCGDATCTEGHAASGRVSSRAIGRKSVANYYYVFADIEGPLTAAQELRFWRFQLFELVRLLSSALRRRRRSDLDDVRGRFEGAAFVARHRREWNR